MAFPTEIKTLRTASLGRGFASLDPERQGEVPSRMIRTVEIRTTGSPQAQRPASGRLDWTRMQPDCDNGMFEGSSSRRGR